MSASEVPTQVHDWQLLEIDDSCCMTPTDADGDQDYWWLCTYAFYQKWNSHICPSTLTLIKNGIPYVMLYLLVRMIGPLCTWWFWWNWVELHLR